MDRTTFSQSNFTSYDGIHEELKKVLDRYLRLTTDREIASFILRQREANSTTYENSLIDSFDPKLVSITNEIRIDYLDESDEGTSKITGNIGAVSVGDQYDATKKIALLMLMANRLAKKYKFYAENNYYRLSPGEIQKYEELEGKCLEVKSMAISSLLSALYIYNKDNDDPRSGINYGFSKDDDDKDVFIIDLPYVGQICVHFGSRTKMERRKSDACDMAKFLIEDRQDGKQLSDQEVQDIRNMILPEYQGKLMEDVSAIPLEMESEKIKEIRKNYKNLYDISAEKADRVIKRFELNPREAHYLAVKLGWPPEIINAIDNNTLNLNQSEDISKTSSVSVQSAITQTKISVDDIIKTSKSTIAQTTAEERFSVRSYEQQQINQQNKESQSIGE